MRLIPVLLFAALGLVPLSSAKIVLPQEVVKEAALAGPMAELRALRDPKEGTAVFAAFEKAAAGGSAEAQFALGYLYSTGTGVERSDGKGEEFYAKSAAQGFVPARNNLAVIRLSTGDDPKAAVAELEALANEGVAAAECGMGQILIDGLAKAGIERDPARAVGWFEKGAAGGDPDAAYALAKLYAGGPVKEVAADAAKAAEYLAAAAAGGHIEALIQLGTRELRGDDAIPKDAQKGMAHLQQAIDAGSTVAIMHTGSLYEAGSGVAQDYAKALEYYTRAWDEGVAAAANKLGFFHEKGLGVTASDAKAAEWYRRGADKGAGVCLYNLAVFQEEGKGGLKADPAEAFRLHYKAAMSAFVPSQVALGLRYRDGKGVARDPQAALAWFERAAQNGDLAGILNCAALLESGAPGFANPSMAARLYRQAGAQGHTGALTSLGRMAEEGRGMNPDFRLAFACYQAAAAGGFQPAADRLTVLKTRLSPEQWKEAEDYARENAEKLVPGGIRTVTPAADDAAKDDAKEAGSPRNPAE